MVRQHHRLSGHAGFTLIELLVVMAIIALLLTIAVPKYFGYVDRSRDAVLRQDLMLMRDALDKYYGDKGVYPETLNDLVTHKYLRNIPRDPVTESNETWIVVAPNNGAKGAVYDIRSGASGNGQDETPYAEW